MRADPSLGLPQLKTLLLPQLSFTQGRVLVQSFLLGCINPLVQPMTCLDKTPPLLDQTPFLLTNPSCHPGFLCRLTLPSRLTSPLPILICPFLKSLPLFLKVLALVILRLISFNMIAIFWKVLHLYQLIPLHFRLQVSVLTLLHIMFPVENSHHITRTFLQLFLWTHFYGHRTFSIFSDPI